MKGTNSDIYDKRLTAPEPWDAFKYVPRCLFFYYVRLNPDKRVSVTHYFYVDGPPSDPKQWKPIPPDQIAAILPELATNARIGGSEPPPSGSNFQDIVCRRKSHFVILVDEEAWALHERGEGRAAVVFNTGKGSTPNHSFFDGQDLFVDIPLTEGSDRRSAIAFINHMKRNSNGEDLLEDESQWFTFDIHLDVEYAGAAAKPLTVLLDPDIENKGGGN